MKKQLLVVEIVLVLLVVGLSGCTETEPTTMTYSELWDDVESINGNTSFTLTSYKDGDILYIKDEVLNVSYGITRINDTDVPITTVYFNSEDELPPPLCFLEDKRPEYPVGEVCTIPVHVKQYTSEDKTVIWLEEWYNTIYLAGLIPTTPEFTPIILFVKTDATAINKLEVYAVDPIDLSWSNIELQINETTQDHGMSGIISLGDVLDLTSIAGTGTYNVSFWYIPTDAIIVRFEFIG